MRAPLAAAAAFVVSPAQRVAWYRLQAVATVATARRRAATTSKRSKAVGLAESDMELDRLPAIGAGKRSAFAQVSRLNFQHIQGAFHRHRAKTADSGVEWVIEHVD